MKKVFISQALFCISVLVLSCQKELTGIDPTPNPVDKTCALTQVSNLQWSSVQEDSTMYTKIIYDSTGRILHLITPKKDTSTYSYFTNRIDVNDPYTADDGTGTEVTYDYKEKYFLQANGLASYSVTTLYSGAYQVDSATYSYDAQGELTEQRFFDFQNGEYPTIDYKYSNGNLQKVYFKNVSTYYPDSMEIKYSNDPMPGESFRFVYWDKYRHYDYYPWTGKMSKNLRSAAIYYYSFGTYQYSYIYDINAEGVPATMRTIETQTGIPSGNATYFLKFYCK